MKKVIEIDLVDKDYLYEKYNKNVISKDLINYIVDKVNPLDKKEKIKIVINNVMREEDCISKLKEGFKNEYEKGLKEYERNNLIQIIYLLSGILLLFFSMVTGKNSIFGEIFLIIGWFVIWEMIEIEIFSDLKNKKRRKVLKKLLDSEIIEK